MIALVFLNDPARTAGIATSLIGKGFQVVAVESMDAARGMITLDLIDLLVLDERIGDALTHSLVLSAERRNPYLSVVMVSDRQGDAADELYELLPSLYAILAPDTEMSVLSKIAIASVADVGAAHLRVRQRNRELLAEIVTETVAHPDREVAARGTTITLSPNERPTVPDAVIDHGEPAGIIVPLRGPIEVINLASLCDPMPQVLAPAPEKTAPCEVERQPQHAQAPARHGWREHARALVALR